MLCPCCWHVVSLLLTCCVPVVDMLCPCCWRVVSLLLTCCVYWLLNWALRHFVCDKQNKSTCLPDHVLIDSSPTELFSLLHSAPRPVNSSLIVSFSTHTPTTRLTLIRCVRRSRCGQKKKWLRRGFTATCKVPKVNVAWREACLSVITSVAQRSIRRDVIVDMSSRSSTEGTAQQEDTDVLLQCFNREGSQLGSKEASK